MARRRFLIEPAQKDKAQAPAPGKNFREEAAEPPSPAEGRKTRPCILDGRNLVNPERRLLLMSQVVKDVEGKQQEQ